MIYNGEFVEVLEMVTKASNYCFATSKNGNEEPILRSATDIYIEQMREIASLPKDDSKEIKWEHLTREGLEESYQRGQIQDGTVESAIAQGLMIFKDVIRITAGDRKLYLAWNQVHGKFLELK